MAKAKRVTTKGYGRKTIGSNIRKLVKAGVPQKQAVAESLSIARQAAKKAGKPARAPKKRNRKSK